MTKDETLQVLSLLRASYPTFYSKFGKRELESIVNLWSEMFEEENFGVVKYALKELIATHSGFPPDIAALKNKIKELCQSATGEPTDEELWQMLKKAVNNGIYGARTEFEKLPPVLKRYVGNPGTLYELACIDSDTFNSVNHGQFLKQIKIIKDREAYSAKMPDSVKMLIQETYIPIEGTTVMTPEELNERRNLILDTIDNMERRKAT